MNSNHFLFRCVALTSFFIMVPRSQTMEVKGQKTSTISACVADKFFVAAKEISFLSCCDLRVNIWTLTRSPSRCLTISHGSHLCSSAAMKEISTEAELIISDQPSIKWHWLKSTIECLNILTDRDRASLDTRSFNRLVHVPSQTSK